MSAAPDSIPATGLTRAKAPTTSSRSLLEVVARQHGVSPLKQFADIWRLKGGRNQMVAKDYYDHQLYLPSYSAAEKREFVGDQGSFALNLKLAPPMFTNMRNFLADKVDLTMLMAGMGLRTTVIQAAFHPFRGFGALPTLRSTAEIRAFLTGPARYPLFGKPIRGVGSFGSVMILDRDGETLHLGNGTAMALDALVAEVAAEVAFGYVFQDAVTPHPDLTAIYGGRAVSTVRAVTINASDRPEMLYALWKMPAISAMSDNFWQKGSLIALVNCATGVVEKVRHGTALDSQWVETHPVTGARLTGITLPGWQSVLDLALGAHSIVPDNGILGWDIALTPEGAQLIECNENTGHGLYQMASGRGVLNADFTPKFAAVEARNARLIAAFDARRKSYQAAKARA